MPAPFLMARSIVSFGTDDFRAASIAARSRALCSGEGSPDLAATVISFDSLPNAVPLFAAASCLKECFH